MDPQSRRAVWEFVLASKAGRATLLTTHFMDEADVLCGSIVVVSKGLLAAVGSPADLKAQYAGGYHLVAALVRDETDPTGALHSKKLLEVTQRHVGDGAHVEEATAEQASLTLPADASDRFPALFEELDAQSAALGVTRCPTRRRQPCSTSLPLVPTPASTPPSVCRPPFSPLIAVLDQPPAF